MIRFVDLRSQSLGHRFAFFDTTEQRFVTVDGFQAWDYWEEFQVDAIEAGWPETDLEAYRDECDDWAFSPHRGSYQHA